MHNTTCKALTTNLIKLTFSYKRKRQIFFHNDDFYFTLRSIIQNLSGFHTAKMTFDSVAKLLCMPISSLINLINCFLAGLFGVRLIMGIAAYLCAIIVYFYGMKFYV